MEAFNIVGNFHLGAHDAVFNIATQIDIRFRDVGWLCMILYVVLSRNKVARFLARLGRTV